MVKALVWTDSAVHDLENIIKYIPNKAEAKSRLSILLSALKGLEQFPKNAKAMKEIPSGKYFEIKVINLRVIFKPDDKDRVILLAIVHDLYR
jgi:plasmid stabilization system protein ParE